MSDYLDILPSLIKASSAIAGAVERMPEDAKKLYEASAWTLRTELIYLAQATDEETKQEHLDNIAHLKSTLTSLDAIADIKLYRTTVKVLLQLTKTAVTLALTL